MKLAFSLFFFLFSVVFTAMSLKFNFLTDSGRPDTGFFPLIIGIGLLFFTGLSVYHDIKERMKASEQSNYGKEMVWVAVFMTVFIFFLNILGSLISMILFIFSILFLFNREKLLQNISISLLVPIIIVAMFDFWLNASLPKGFLGFI